MRTLAVFLLIAGVALAGCGKDRNNKASAQEQAELQQQQSQTSAPADQSGQTGNQGNTNVGQSRNEPAPARTEPRPAPRPSRSEPKPPREQRPAEPQTVTRLVPVPTGAEITADIDQTLSTKTDPAGTAFRATLREPYSRDGVVLLPAGSVVRGTVARAKRAPRVGGKAEMTLEFNELTTPDGKSYQLFAQPLTLEGKSSTEGDVAKTVGGAVGGAIVGGILGGKKGAGRGAAAGGAAGAVWAVATRGADIVLDSGTPVKVTVAREFEVPVHVRSDQPLP